MSRRVFDCSSRFKKDIRKVSKTINLALLPEWIEVMSCLLNNIQMSREREDHDLTGDWNGFRECHILPDLLLIYKKNKAGMVELARLGSHSELKITN